MTEDKLARIHDPDDPVFTERERAVLRFTTAMIENRNGEGHRPEAADEVFAEMRRHFDEPQIVEIGFTAATMFLFAAFATGPFSIAAPVAGSYPL